MMEPTAAVSEERANRRLQRASELAESEELGASEPLTRDGGWND